MLIPLVFARGEHLPGQGVLADAAFDSFYNLEYDKALAAFEVAAAKNPESADTQNHIAQTILFREMFRGGMLQSQMLTSSNSFLRMPKIAMCEADQKEFSESIGRAMILAQSRLRDDPNDAGALYALGVSFGLRGEYNFAVRKAYLDALHDMTAARKYHNRVTRVDPLIVDAELTQGVYDYVVGSLPFGWKMLGFLGGFQGNRARGTVTLERVAREGNINRIDASIFLAAIYRREHRPEDAACILEGLIPALPRNYLLRLELAEMYGDMRNREAAMRVLDDIERLQKLAAPGYEALPPKLVPETRQQILIEIERIRASVGG